MRVKKPEDIFETIANDYSICFTDVEKASAFQSPFQKVEIVNTKSLGKIFRLDGCNMTSEIDEFLYHEPMNHIGLLAQDNPKTALIIGGGDGGSVDEILKHPSIEKIVLVELDPEVIRISQEDFQKVNNNAFASPKLEVVIEDGYTWLPRAHRQNLKFDMVVMDLTDPIGPSEALYTSNFFKLIKNVLAESGCMSIHIGHAFFHRSRFVNTIISLQEIFKFVCPLHVSIPLYGGDWGMAIVSDQVKASSIPKDVYAKRINQRKLQDLQWLNPECLLASFALPNYLLKLINSAND